MIRYDLKCANGHGFDAWFASSDGFDRQLADGQVRCAICGSQQVEKALMAPARAGTGSEPDQRGTEIPDLSTPASEAEAAMAELRDHIETHSEDVGTRFAQEARSMHDGETPERSIYGQANAEEARALIEDGVPVAPLPFIPKRRSN